MKTYHEFLNNPCLNYIQIPQHDFNNMPGANGFRAFANVRINPWDGYTDVKHEYLETVTPADVEQLQAAGWNVDDYMDFWIRLTPPANGAHTLNHLVKLVTDRYPEMATRMDKARELVEKDRVHKSTIGQHNYIVHSLTEPYDHYQAYIDPGNRPNWRCVRLLPKNETRKCPDMAQNAPFLNHGKRCKHLMAAWLYRQSQQKEASTVAAVEASPEPKRVHSTTDSTTATPAPSNGTRRLVSRYADGRPARYSDGTIVRYTAGGTAVHIPGR